MRVRLPPESLGRHVPRGRRGLASRVRWVRFPPGPIGLVAQLARAPGLHPGSRRFDPGRAQRRCARAVRECPAKATSAYGCAGSIPVTSYGGHRGGHRGMVPNPARTRGQLGGWEFDSSAHLLTHPESELQGAQPGRKPGRSSGPPGSIPGLSFARVAQSAEQLSCKQHVAGSRPVSGFCIDNCAQLW